MELEGYRDKLIEYDNHLDTLGERNSYSKTDPGATFMRIERRCHEERADQTRI